MKAAERQEEEHGVNLLAEAERVRRKAWELFSRTESEGDHRASIVALREVRECLESLGEMLSHAGPEGGGPLSRWSNDELRAELEQRGEKLNNIVIRFERVKDGKPCDCPCCTAERNEGSG